MAPSKQDLLKLSKQRIEDARFLFEGERYHSTVYLAGYALELSLKARICMHLGWLRFDETFLQKHSLKFLFRFAGLDKEKESFMGAWSLVSDWNPEMRYDAVREFGREEAMAFLQAAQVVHSKLYEYSQSN